MPRSTLPWRRPRHELLLLAFVAVAALSPVYVANPQDSSRLCLTQALVHGHLSNDGCFGFDSAGYGGHEFSDKAPGLSVLQLPASQAVRLPPANRLQAISWQLWLVRLLSSGLAFLACAFMVGRIGEGLAPGFGAASLVAFALGTLVGLFAATSFDQVPAATLGFGAFVLAWGRRPLLAGLAASTAVVVEYQAALILVVLLAYVAFAERAARPIAWFLVGVLPGAAILAAYDSLAFGAPWHLSYRYVANAFHYAQGTGFFGIGVPRVYGSYEVFAGSSGLLVASPVLVAAAWGLVLLAREHRLEALVCGTVTAAFVLVNCGYFLPYGGSPGPRFLLPALPFLALGLAPAFAWRPRLTAVLAVLSVAAMTGRMLLWGDPDSLRAGVWGEMARVPAQLGASRFVRHLEFTPLDWVAPGRTWGAAAVALTAAAALVIALRATPLRAAAAARAHGADRRRQPRRIGRSLVVASVCVVVAAEASAVFGYPYSHPPTDLSVSIQGSSPTVARGGETDFSVWAANASGYQGYAAVRLTIALAPGMRLLGTPWFERGSGCTGTSTLTCFLGDLSPRMSTPIRFGVRIASVGEQTLTASLSATGVPPQRAKSYTVAVDSG